MAKDTVNKKKKFSFKKVKRLFKKIVFSIFNFFENLYHKFMNLKDYIRYIIYVWTGVLLVIIILIVISISNSKYKSDYIEIEKKINEASLLYVQQNELYPLRENKLRLSTDMLIDLGYLNKVFIKDETCTGFSEVYYDGDDDTYYSNAYINCKKYTSDGYLDKK